MLDFPDQPVPFRAEFDRVHDDLAAASGQRQNTRLPTGVGAVEHLLGIGTELAQLFWKRFRRYPLVAQGGDATFDGGGVEQQLLLLAGSAAKVKSDRTRH